MSRTINVTSTAAPAAGKTISSTTYRLLAADGTTVLSTAAPPYVGVTDATLKIEQTVTQSDGQTNVLTHDIPGRVTDLAASSAAAPVLTWTDIGGETSYEIHRGAAGFTPDVAGHTTRVGTAALNAATFTDSTVVGNGSTVYAYRAVALTTFGYTIGAEATCTPAAPTVTNAVVFNSTGYGKTSASAADIESATALAVEYRIRGDKLKALTASVGDLRLLTIGDAALGDAATQLILVGRKDTDTSHLNLTCLTVDGSSGQSMTLVPISLFSDAAYYTLYAHRDASPVAGASAREFEIRDDSGTVIVAATPIATATALTTGAGRGSVAVSARLSGSIPSAQVVDGLAIYSRSLAPASRHSATAPTTGDANILRLWTFNTGTGTTDTDAKVGAVMTLIGATWVAGGTW